MCVYFKYTMFFLVLMLIDDQTSDIHDPVLNHMLFEWSLIELFFLLIVSTPAKIFLIYLFA